jgi:conjugative transposon TraN protein
MKQLCVVLVACMLGLQLNAQPTLKEAARPIKISTAATTSVLFPGAVRRVDIGSADVLVETVKEAPNLLFVKAGVARFPSSNLSVVTEDGDLYAFPVVYDSLPATSVYNINKSDRRNVDTGKTLGQWSTPSALRKYSDIIMNLPRFLHGRWTRKWDIKLQLGGIYVKENLLFFQLSVYNNSPIDYPVSNLRFYIRDQQKARRTAAQEVMLEPVSIVGNTTLVKAGTISKIVIALPSFTIPDQKVMVVEMLERNGGRHLRLKTGNSSLLKARSLY